MTEQAENETVPEAGTENLSGEAEDRSTFVRRIQEAWRDTVGTYATDDGETRNLFMRLVDFGALSREEATRLISEAKTSIDENRQELDHRVDESLKATLKALTIPSSAEIAELETTIEVLEKKLAELEAKKKAQGQA